MAEQSAKRQKVESSSSDESNSSMSVLDRLHTVCSANSSDNDDSGESEDLPGCNGRWRKPEEGYRHSFECCQYLQKEVEKMQKRIKDLQHEAAWYAGMWDLWQDSIDHHYTDNFSRKYWLNYDACRCCEKECDYTKGEGCGGKTVDGVLYCGLYNPKDDEDKNEYLIGKASECTCRNDASSDALWEKANEYS